MIRERNQSCRARKSINRYEKQRKIDRPRHKAHHCRWGMFVLEALQPFITCTTVLVSVANIWSTPFGRVTLSRSTCALVLCMLCFALRRWCKRFGPAIPWAWGQPLRKAKALRKTVAENLDRKSKSLGELDCLTSHKLENSKTRYQATRQGKS